MALIRRMILLMCALAMAACSGGGWNGGPTVAGAPAFSVPSGRYLAGQQVFLSAPAGSSIWYSFAGNPFDNLTGIHYSIPIYVSDNVTITAAALHPGYDPSDNVTATYEIVGLRAVAGGTTHTVLLAADGTVWALGGNEAGQLGDGTRTDSAVPLRIAGLDNVTAIGAGAGTTYALKSDLTLWALGWNLHGQLGDGTTTDRPAPVLVMTDVHSFAVGMQHVVAVKTDRTVWTWGLNASGQLGDGTTDDKVAPALVPGLDNVTAVAASSVHSMALAADRTVWEWGATGYYSGSTVSPVLVAEIDNVTAIFAGSTGVSGAIRQGGTLWTWGSAASVNPFMNGLDNNGVWVLDVPTQVPGISNVASAACTATQAVALGTNSVAYWVLPGFTWDQVAGLDLSAAVSRGYDWMFVRCSDKTLWGWGNNGSGQLGTGNTSAALNAVPRPFRY
jgi:alpha-tubulin suppressor-like RCC1 family protein